MEAGIPKVCSRRKTFRFPELLNGSSLNTVQCMSGVRSLKELWEGNGNSHSHNSDTVMGTGREPGIFPFKKICRRQLRIASESEKVFARIFDDFFRCFDLPKRSVFSGQTIQNFKTLTPPLIF